MSPPAAPANTPRVRTRNGCWVCRKRRRKCDERKPRCQNCIDKNRDCSYEVQLTFLEANMLTLVPEDVDDLQKRLPKSANIDEFVDGLEESQESLELGLDESGLQFDQLTTSQHGDQTISPAAAAINTRRFLQNLTEPHLLLEGGGDGGDEFDGSFTAHGIQSPTSTSHGNPMPNAIVGETFTSPTRSLHSGRVDPSMMISSWHRSPDSGHTQSSVHFQRDDSEDDRSLSQKLMKIFIDDILPWLDICSPGSPHSAFLPLIFTKHRPLRLATLALTANQSSNDSFCSHARFTERAVASLNADLQSYHKDTKDARKLLVISRLVSKSLNSWKFILIDEPEIINSPKTSWDDNGPLDWVLIRFTISVSLISQLPPIMKLEEWAQIQPPRDLSSPTSILENSLLLCAHTANFCFSQSTSGTSATDKWLGLYSLYQEMQSYQIPELMPLLTSAINQITHSPHASTMSSGPVNFSFTVHTTRHSFYISFLSHLTALLLLQRRALHVSHQLLRKLKTETWHALQICALSLSNKLIWSHDPVIIAALLWCGRMLSYGKQQDELISHLRTLRELTGWKFEAEIEALEREMQECRD